MGSFNMGVGLCVEAEFIKNDLLTLYMYFKKRTNKYNLVAKIKLVYLQ